jgi:hypothetical protein
MAILESRTKTGISWVSESIALFKQAPRRWMLLALSYVGIFILIPSFPGLQIFAFLTIIIWPIFIAVAMRMYRNTEFNKTENLSTILQSLQPNIKKLMMLGFFSLAYFIVVSIIMSADVQALADILDKKAQMNEQEMMLAMQTMTPILIKVMLLFIPLFVSVWFAPMLIAFNNYSVIKALKSSIAGAIQYMVAITAAWLLLSAGIIALMMAATVVAGLFSMMNPAVAQTLLSLLLFGAVLISIALTFAFQYVTYRDIFRAA